MKPARDIDDSSFRIKLILSMLFLCAILIAYVCLTVETAEARYEINKVEKQISEVEKDIRYLQVEIKTASNITNIEARAIELGMVYPSFDQVKYLRYSQESVPDLALALMETAYR